MAWNTNTITEPLIAAGAAVAVIAITFITALIDDFRVCFLMVFYSVRSFDLR